MGENREEPAARTRVSGGVAPFGKVDGVEGAQGCGTGPTRPGPAKSWTVKRRYRLLSIKGRIDPPEGERLVLQSADATAE
jgi:hypothetical protein